jgi:hypothetical protein
VHLLGERGGGQQGGSTMQFKPLEPGVEVFGASVDAIVAAFKLFPSVALKRLVHHGVGSMKGTEVVIEREAWYPLEGWLAAYQNIAEQVGPRAVFQIGQHIPKHAVFPPTVNDITSGVASIDVAYHMNHRKNGRVMFDPQTGQKLKGIGNYGFAPVAGERRIVSVCDNPYPCDFDRGILTAMAARFERQSRVSHDDKGPCRKNGADSCTYTVSW